MINYKVFIDSISHGTIQATSRIEAVRLANEVHKGCGGIHLSKLSEWGVR